MQTESRVWVGLALTIAWLLYRVEQNDRAIVYSYTKRWSHCIQMGKEVGLLDIDKQRGRVYWIEESGLVNLSSVGLCRGAVFMLYI